MVLIIDNYDSFIYNIVHVMDYDISNILIRRNDKISINEIEKLAPMGIIISPGPMSPQEAGLSNEIIKTFASEIPILGICLGHQCIGQVFNCSVDRYYSPTHGKQSLVELKSSKLYEGLEKSVTVGRYHSLYISNTDFQSNELKVNAVLEDNTIMGVEHVDLPVYGVQFHPESVLSMQENTGKTILNNFINICETFNINRNERLN